MSIRAYVVTDPDELLAVRERVSAAFGDVFDNSDPTPAARIPELSIGVRRDDRLIGGCFTLDMNLAFPGGAQLPSAALAAVGIEPSAMGAGGMTAMMDLHLAEARQFGLATSVLTASETGLYGRYGYGCVSTVCRYRIDLGRAQLSGRAPLGDGTVRLILDRAEARSVVEHVHRLAERRSAMTHRTPALWDVVLAEKPNWTGGGQRFVAAHYPAGSEQANGYLIYAVDHPETGLYLPEGRVRLDELVTSSLEAELLLWNFIIGIPLARGLDWIHAPVDPAVFDYLVDQRQLVQTRRVDNLWMRILDIERVLAARTYYADGEVKIWVSDPQFSEQTGVYSVSVRGGNPQIEFEATVDAPESSVVMDLSQLSSILMGERRVSHLARTGLISGTSEALVELDRLMLVDQPPFSLTRF